MPEISRLDAALVMSAALVVLLECVLSAAQQDNPLPSRSSAVDLDLRHIGDYGGITHANGKAFLLSTRRPGVQH